MKISQYNMLHGDISAQAHKRFALDGVINDDAAIYRLQQEYIRLLVSEMRLSGYSPRIDIDPQFTLSYNENKNYFEFTLSVYGIYIGRKNQNGY